MTYTICGNDTICSDGLMVGFTPSLSVLKVNGEIVRTVNGKNLSSFNGISIMSGVVRSWRYPVQDGEKLTITQVLNPVQDDSKLYIGFDYYTVTIEGEGGQVTGSGTYREGTSVTLSATPEEGYDFIGFTIGSEEIVENPYTFMPTEDTHVVAVFEYIPKSYTLQLSGIASYSWSKTSSPANPDETLYDGVYIPSNKGVHSSYAAMRIDFVGYENFVVYIRSYAESSYDYVIASQLDAASYPTSGSGAKASTSGNQRSGTSISDYTKVEYANDGGAHHIYIVYRKDGSASSGNDLGYVLIGK